MPSNYDIALTSPSHKGRSHTPPKVTPRLIWWVPIVTTACFGVLLYFSMSRLNPDWLSYQLIYETGGAWLSEQGRGPAFLALTSFLASIFGVGDSGYETYRYLLAFYFMAFIALLSSGRIFKINPTGGGYASLVLAIIYLGITRFTIQIREGLAITLVIFSLALFARYSCNQKQVALNAIPHGKSWRNLQISMAWFLLLLASITHEGTLLVLLIAIAAWWATNRTKFKNMGLVSPHERFWRMSLLWLIAVLLAGATLVQLYLGGYLENLASVSVGDRFVDTKSISFAQFGLWSLYGVVIWFVFRESRFAIKEGRVNGIFATFLRVLSGPALMSTYVSIVVALLIAVTPLFIVGYVRLLHMLLALALVCLAVIGRRGWLMVLTSTFLIVDQIRSIVESISMYSGVQLF